MPPRFLLVWVLVLLGAFTARAQEAEETTEPTGPSRLSELSREFSDPLTTLPQVFLQDVYTPANYGTDAPANRLILRAIVPRIPRLSLMPAQLVRPTISLVTVPTGRGSETKTAFGDMQLIDLGVIPWPGRETGLLMGVGPIFVFPTASDDFAGQGAWQIGPAFGVIYKGLPGVILGTLIQNPISFAYTSGDRPSVNTLLFQPILLTYLGHGFYLKSADASWTFGWKGDRPIVIPVSLGLGYVLLREDAPPLNLFVTGEWTAYRESAPVAPQTTVRFGVTVAIPNWRPWR